jgi:hypothetical protein
MADVIYAIILVMVVSAFVCSAIAVMSDRSFRRRRRQKKHDGSSRPE